MKKLTELRAGEVSLVKEGANRRKFLIFKSQDGKPAAAAVSAVPSGSPEAMQKVQAVLDAHFQSAPKAPDLSAQAVPAPAPPAQPGVIAPEENDQIKHALQAIVRILSPWNGKITPAILQEVVTASGFGKAADPAAQDPAQGAGDAPADPAKPKTEEPPMAADDKTPPPAAAAPAAPAADDKNKIPPAAPAAGAPAAAPAPGNPDDAKKEPKKEDMVAAKKAAGDAYKAAMEKLGYSKFPELQVANDDHQGGSQVTNVIKSADGTLDLSAVPEAVRPVVEAIHKSNQELVQKAADLEKKLNDRDAADRKREIVAKAATYTHLGLKQEDIVASLEDAAKSGTESLARMEKQFSTMNEQIKKSALFTEVGSAASGTIDAEAKIDAAVAQVVAKSAGGVTKEQAYADFIQTDEGQKLYAEFKSSRKDGI